MRGSYIQKIDFSSSIKYRSFSISLVALSERMCKEAPAMKGSQLEVTVISKEYDVIKANLLLQFTLNASFS